MAFWAQTYRWVNCPWQLLAKDWVHCTSKPLFCKKTHGFFCLLYLTENGNVTFDGRAVLRHDVAGQRGQGDGHKHHEQAGDLVLLLRADVFCTDQSTESAAATAGTDGSFPVVQQPAGITDAKWQVCNRKWRLFSRLQNKVFKNFSAMRSASNSKFFKEC